MPLDRIKTEKASAIKSQARLSSLQSGAKVLGSEGNVCDQSGTSVFDPVLCELILRWFCPRGGKVLDPFAGEATKGIVAEMLAYKYTGIELRREQVEENHRQSKSVGVNPTWIIGDAGKIDSLISRTDKFDFVWTSPPYFDLEIYSDRLEDGSAFANYDIFMTWYKAIFAECVKRLNDNRFLAVKVGEIRDRLGIYRNFVGENVAIFKGLGLKYYNEIIFVTAVGSLPVRVGRHFQASRKIGKTHQNILVFFKGNPRRIRDNFGDIDISEQET